MEMGVHMKVCGSIINEKEKASLYALTERNTMANGETTDRQEAAVRAGLMDHIMTASIKMDWNMVTVSFVGLTRAPMLEDSITTWKKEKDVIVGTMARPSKEIGRIIRCMEKESLYGLTAEHTKDNTSTIEKKAMVFSYGQPVKNTKATGLIISNMVKDTTSRVMERRGLHYGITVNESSG